MKYSIFYYSYWYFIYIYMVIQNVMCIFFSGVSQRNFQFKRFQRSENLFIHFVLIEKHTKHKSKKINN